jgi:hypothetical protein
MNLTEEKKAPLRDKKVEEKRALLAMQFKGSIQVISVLATSVYVLIAKRWMRDRR